MTPVAAIEDCSECAIATDEDSGSFGGLPKTRSGYSSLTEALRREKDVRAAEPDK
jgi:hypothetical protein